MLSPVLAHLEPDVNSLWAETTPTIDGTLVSGEWADATTRDFQLSLRSRTDGTLQKTLEARFYVKNNLNNLYFAVQIFDDDYEAQDFANEWNGLAVLFEENHDGIVESGDNGEGVTTWTGSPFYSKNDLHYTGSYWEADLNVLKTNDGNIVWSHTNPVQGAIGDWTFEMVIPLVGSDGDAYDFAITHLPKTTGFKIWFQEPGKGTDGVYPDDPAINKNIQEIANGATYGTLIIHPLYYLTIQTTSGGTTNPSPGVYPYGYGTLVSVTALPSAGYLLDYWELDTINVGSTNPYSVTMNQNHTLKAVFTQVPPRPVGGKSFSTGTVTPSNPPILLFVSYAIVLISFGITARKLRIRKG